VAALAERFEEAYRAAAERRGWNVCTFSGGDKTSRTWVSAPHWELAAEAILSISASTKTKEI
jgi:hypothetical protein